MRLYEFEGKDLLKQVSIPVPDGILVSDPKEIHQALHRLNPEDSRPCAVVKAQVLSGGRKKAGVIEICETKDHAIKAAERLFKGDVRGEKIGALLLERPIEKKAEHYISITFDTEARAPAVLVSAERGGIDVEELTKTKGVLAKHVINVAEGFQAWHARAVLKAAGFESRAALQLTPILLRLWECFTRYDCRVAEINPLIETPEGDFFAADAKLDIDDAALYRHDDLMQKLPPRNPLRPFTKAELAAREIDRNDHRGTAGSTYVELDGDIAILAAGGGASLVCMDALLEHGGEPANYTEYSGNPPAEKLARLTKIVLSKKGLRGCWVVGVKANYTDVYETMRGFLEGLRQIKPKPIYPFVIRRGGPRQEEAFKMLREAAKKEGYDFHIYGPETSMTSTAKTVVDLSKRSAEKNR